MAVNHSECVGRLSSDQPAPGDKSHNSGATGIFVSNHQPSLSYITFAPYLNAKSKLFYSVSFRTHPNFDITAVPFSCKIPCSNWLTYPFLHSPGVALCFHIRSLFKHRHTQKHTGLLSICSIFYFLSSLTFLSRLVSLCLCSLQSTV